MAHQQSFIRRLHFLSILTRLVLALLVAALGVLPAPVAHAATITVDSTLDNTTAGDGNCTLREAINNANADADTTGGDCAAGTGNDTITLPANIYTLTGAAGDNANNSGDLDILAAGGDLTINGAGAGSTIIDGNNNDRVIHITAGGFTVNISGVTIRNGNPGASGGGIYNDAGTVTLANSAIYSNQAPLGGGILNAGVGATLSIMDSAIYSNTGSVDGGGIGNFRAVTITNSSIYSNTAADDGGGIYNSGSGTVRITGCTLSHNTATDDGGGIYNSGAVTVTITNSTLSSNEVTAPGGVGGGIYNLSGTVIITDSSTLSGNEAYDGGGIYNDDGAVTISNSTVHSNTSGDDGGGIYSDGDGGGATLTLNRCTVSGNTANSSDYSGGGGIYLYYSSAALTNTTISGNVATTTHGGGIGTLSDEARTIDLVNCTIYINTAGGNGGGMQLEPTFTVNVLNTVVAGDSAGGNGPDIYGTINSQDYNLIQDTSSATINGTTTHNITGVDPLLGPLADNGGDTQTHALMAGSLAIDHVPVISCTVATDQRGVARPQSSACDIGAYEAAPELSIGKTATPATGVTYHSIVTYTVMLNNSGAINGTNVLLTDTLPGEVDFAHWVAQPAGASVAADRVTWSGTVPANTAITFVFAVTHTGDYGDVVTNAAEYGHASGSGDDDATFTVQSMNFIYLPLVLRNV